MKFAVITHTIHKEYGNKLFAYEPYVREMNLWLKQVSQAKIVAPISTEAITAIETSYTSNTISFNKIASFDVLTFKNKIKSIFKIPIICFKIFKAMLWADHIHLRCPGNIGLLGCIVQIFFPLKQKTVKYAGNWDPKSKQPLSYRFQKWLLNNTFLTRNCKVLVYGEWKNQSKNIIPFFTASYKKNEIVSLPNKELKVPINFIYVGAFTKGKQPMLSVNSVEQLFKDNLNVELHMYGNGEEYENVEQYVKQNNLQKVVFLHGNQSKNIIKKAYQDAHFLVFISKSEGWPKVVAEAMFWSCLPIASKVSCVPFMLDEGNRGGLVNSDVEEIVQTIKKYIKNETKYQQQVNAAKEWSQLFTLEAFELEIVKMLKNG